MTKEKQRVDWHEAVEAAGAAKVSISPEMSLPKSNQTPFIETKVQVTNETTFGVAHRQRPLPDSTDWAIYSPNVPVFRTDNGTILEKPWLLSFLTCAAPYAPGVGLQKSGDLLQKRIHRILAIAQAYGHAELILGAWGCGAFRNDPHRTAMDFRQALEHDFSGAFSEVVFAITDWSPE